MTTPLKQSEEAEIRLKRAYKSFMSLRPLANEDPMWDVAEAMWNRQEAYWQQQLAQSKVEIEELKEKFNRLVQQEYRIDQELHKRTLEKMNLETELVAEKLLSSQLKAENKRLKNDLSIASSVHSLYLTSEERLSRERELRKDRPLSSDNHSGDCHIYSSLINGCPTDGICTCGYGLSWLRAGDYTKLISGERLAKERESSDALTTSKVENEKLESILRNVMEYLHDTDELGEEYLTPHAKKWYSIAREALGLMNQTTKSEPVTDSACKIKELSASLTAAKEAIKVLREALETCTMYDYARSFDEVKVREALATTKKESE